MVGNETIGDILFSFSVTPVRHRVYSLVRVLMKMNTCIDDKNLPGNAIRAAEIKDLLGNVLNAGCPFKDSAFFHGVNRLRRDSLGHPGALHEFRSDAVHRHIRGQRHRKASGQMHESRFADGMGDAAAGLRQTNDADTFTIRPEFSLAK